MEESLGLEGVGGLEDREWMALGHKPMMFNKFRGDLDCSSILKKKTLIVYAVYHEKLFNVMIEKKSKD